MRQLTPPLLCPQFAAWVDAVVFVFSLEDEISFQTVYNYFLRLSSYRNTAEVPMVLVGTQGACLTSDIYALSRYRSSVMELNTGRTPCPYVVFTLRKYMSLEYFIDLLLATNPTKIIKPKNDPANRCCLTFIVVY